MYSKVTIIGLGLMGGSLAKALRERKLAHEIWALAKSPESKSRFEKMNIVDRVTVVLEEAVENADVILLCVTPSLIIEYMKKIARKAAPDTLIIDVGSSKQKIMALARTVFSSRHNFVGAHPMAGSEKTGAENASADLFENSLCFITPSKKNGFWKKTVAFWSSIGCEPVTMSASEHDRLVAYVSHLPHVLAFSLIRTVPEKLRVYGAGGYKSVERLSRSDPELWADIFLSNQPQILRALAAYQRQLTRISACLKQKRRKDLLRALNSNTIEERRDCRH